MNIKPEYKFRQIIKKLKDTGYKDDDFIMMWAEMGKRIEEGPNVFGFLPKSNLNKPNMSITKEEFEKIVNVNIGDIKSNKFKTFEE